MRLSRSVWSWSQHGLVAGLFLPGENRAAVARRIGLPGREAAIALPRLLRSLGIDLVEIIEHGTDRRVQAVDIETVELGALVLGDVAVVLAHPVDEVRHLLIAPHPGRKALEGRVVAFRHGAMAHVSVDARRIGPVGLDRDDGEAVLLDQASA